MTDYIEIHTVPTFQTASKPMLVNVASIINCIPLDYTDQYERKISGTYLRMQSDHCIHAIEDYQIIKGLIWGDD